MRYLGRAIGWPEAEQHAIAKEGTLICEILWNGARLWWTPEILANQTPFTYCRQGDKDKSPFDKEFQAFGKWCFENYTNPSMGRAALIEIPKGSRRLIWKRIDDAGFEYVLTHYRDKPKGQATKNGE